MPLLPTLAGERGAVAGLLHYGGWADAQDVRDQDAVGGAAADVPRAHRAEAFWELTWN